MVTPILYVLSYAPVVRVRGRIAYYAFHEAPVVLADSSLYPPFEPIDWVIDNTPLRELLLSVLEACKAAADSPPSLLLKVAPDLTGEDKEDIAAVALETGIDGLIATNTTIDRPDGLKSPNREESGGLSGRPLFEPSTRVLADFYRLTEGRLPLIGTGGVSSGAEAYAKIRCGASLVQLYTAMIYQGPGIATQINRQLLGLLQQDGFTNVSEAVGADVS